MNDQVQLTEQQKLEKLIKKIIKISIPSLIVFIVAMGSIFTVQEGHEGIVKRFGKAISQTGPGIHLKAPFIDSVIEIEIRTRKNEEAMASSTSEQMPVTVKVSVNWTVDKTAALDMYKQYGGLKQFENRILDPRFRSATKDIIPHFDAETLIRNRTQAITQIQEALVKSMATFPVTVDNVQIENIELPHKYILSIETKQTEKNLADAETHKLRRFDLTAQQAEKTADSKAAAIETLANAAATAIEVKAIAEAGAIRVKGEAYAHAIKEKSKALRGNPLIIELTKAERWNGAVPSTMMGDGQNVLFGIK